jgi:protein ImuB
VLVFEDPAACTALVDSVKLERLHITTDLREGLAALGIVTLGDLRAIPETALLARFGPEASQHHRQLSGDSQLPLQAALYPEPLRVSFEVDPPDDHRHRLLFGIKGALHELVRAIVIDGTALTAIRLELALDAADQGPIALRVETARPTRDPLLVLDLVRLRLESLEIGAPVEKVVLIAETARPQEEQLALFAVSSVNLDAGNRAIARLRAAFGPRSVTRAELRQAHLPEAQFRFEPISRLTSPRARFGSLDWECPKPTLVRRVLARPRPIGVDAGSFVRLFGPYRISGGWWARTVERDYYYGETDRRSLLWLFFDRLRRRWYLHGIVD